MFKLAVSPTYKCPITVELPGGERHTFDALFRRLEQDDVERYHAGLADGTFSEDEILDAVLAGWDKVADEDGTPLEFNPANRNRLLAVFPVRGTLAMAWVQSLSGAREKNLPTPPDTGRHK